MATATASLSPTSASSSSTSTSSSTTTECGVMQASLDLYREALGMNNSAVSFLSKGFFLEALKIQRDALSTLQRAFASPSPMAVVVDAPTTKSEHPYGSTDFPQTGVPQPQLLQPPLEENHNNHDNNKFFLSPHANFVQPYPNEPHLSSFTSFSRSLKSAAASTPPPSMLFPQVHPVEENDFAALVGVAMRCNPCNVVSHPVYIRESPTVVHEHDIQESSILVARQSSIMLYNLGILEYMAFLLVQQQQQQQQQQPQQTVNHYHHKANLTAALSSFKLSSETLLRLLVQSNEHMNNRHDDAACRGRIENDSIMVYATLALNGLGSCASAAATVLLPLSSNNDNNNNYNNIHNKDASNLWMLPEEAKRIQRMVFQLKNRIVEQEDRFYYCLGEQMLPQGAMAA